MHGNQVAKTPLLFVCHRIPYPPNKGDKIRAFHLLHHLSQSFDIFLATFVDDPDDWHYVPDVEKFCVDSLFVDLKPWRATLQSITAFLTGDALSNPYYRSQKMASWISKTVSEYKIQHAMVYSSSMAQFVKNDSLGLKRKIIDFVDIDSDKWHQYAQQKKWPLSWLYQREANYLLALEKKLALEFDAGLFVSSAEATLFRKMAPETATKIGHYNNGVNADYFDPNSEYLNPYPDGCMAVVFTGAMDYWPNVDAVTWFVRSVMPHLRRRHPKVLFYIVGGSPSRAVRQLDSIDGVVVTGRVEDIRPYMFHAVAAVAPMRVARGVQNKVLEAMSMARPVVVSTKGLEGIQAKDQEQVLVADTVEDYIACLAQLVAGPHGSIGENARAHVVKYFDWGQNLPEVALLLAEDQIPPLCGLPGRVR